MSERQLDDQPADHCHHHVQGGSIRRIGNGIEQKPLTPKPTLTLIGSKNNDHRFFSRRRQFLMAVLAVSVCTVAMHVSDVSSCMGALVEKRTRDHRNVKVTEFFDASEEQLSSEGTTRKLSPQRDNFAALARQQQHPSLVQPPQSQEQEHPHPQEQQEQQKQPQDQDPPAPPAASVTFQPPPSSPSSSSPDGISGPSSWQNKLAGTADRAAAGGPRGRGKERGRHRGVPSFDRSRGLCGDRCQVDYNLSQVQLPHESCRGKERLVQILTAAGTQDINKTVCEALPSWQSVKDLYGDHPVIYGLDTCQEYRRLLSHSGTSKKPTLRVAGLCNSGTNAFAGALDLNFDPWVQKHSRNKYHVPWGKHLSAKYKWNVTLEGLENETVNKSEVLPIVIVKDPYRWFASMCKASYFVEWDHVPEHCPNLVRGRRTTETGAQFDTYTVKVPYWQTVLTDHYNSLADMWSEWINEYLSADYPRLIIRYEDVLFHAERVMELVTACAVGDGNPPPMATKTTTSNKRRRNRERKVQPSHSKEPLLSFQYYVKRAKKNGHASDFFSALAKAGTDEGRYTCLTDSDIEYAGTALYPELMDLFHYKTVSVDNFTRSSGSSREPSLLCPGLSNQSHPHWIDKWAQYRESEQEHPFRRPD